MEKRQFAEKVLEAFDGYIIQNESRHMIGYNKDPACYYLMYKMFVLFRNLLSLLDTSQIHASAYLVRGIIETRADINFIIKAPDNVAAKFLQTSKLVRRSRINVQNGFNRRLLSKVENWATDQNGNKTSTCNRVSRLGKEVIWAYSLICAYTHSSSAGMDDMARKEINKIVNEQLFIATHNVLETMYQFGNIHSLNIQEVKDLIDEFDSIYVTKRT